MLLDAVSVLLLVSASRLHSMPSLLFSFDRVFSASLASTISPLATAGYFQLAKEFDVSVDQVASSFSAANLGNGIILYAMLFQPVASS